ncbi:hypothetical protein U14_05921 [Candidatus Moduliflexus flocculans]|uniref:B12-binding domain-containing protein n=1 Tax=Candidatus Moduliflexus flocculans TaxID=1499966 RepID=A0A081BTA3_9BACT|nr:hypothetical protein U14_05921 [Candidatus Moduliflexus flocculans]
MPKIALIYPPTCDPTAPYLALPTLTAFLRTHGVEVLPIDANIEAYCRLLRRDTLEKFAERIERRRVRLERKRVLTHVEQLAFADLHEARQIAQSVPAEIDDAVAVLRDRSGVRFFDPEQYAAAIATVDDALRLISAAYSPLTLDFLSYRTPFSLLTLDTIRADSQADRNPFYDYVEQELCERLAASQVSVIGLSVAFPGQVQPAYAFALHLRRRFPHLYITVGGPAMTQLLLRLPEAPQQKALTPFDSAVVFEGETALLELARAVERGERPAGLIRGTCAANLAEHPAPDFDGIPLDKYLAPAPVLPYDPTRGCYWGKCAFCHYGLAEHGTARYRQRPPELVAQHVEQLAQRHTCRVFYFSQDAMSPAFAEKVAEQIQRSGAAIRWGTDMRPEAALTAERCRVLASGGMISAALGIESAAPRVLELINKGIAADTMTAAAQHLAAAGIAVEAMTFTDFPTETAPEARRTLQWLEAHSDSLALFICGRFDLVDGAQVALVPQKYGIREMWRVTGDELFSGLFYEETRPPKTEREQANLDAALDRLAEQWWLHHYPWAGSLSTAHTLLWYDRFGADIFRRLAGHAPKARHRESPLPAAVARLAERARQHEADIWHTMIYERRAVSPELYRTLAAALRPVRNSVS